MACRTGAGAGDNGREVTARVGRGRERERSTMDGRPRWMVATSARKEEELVMRRRREIYYFDIATLF